MHSCQLVCVHVCIATCTATAQLTCQDCCDHSCTAAITLTCWISENLFQEKEKGPTFLVDKGPVHLLQVQSYASIAPSTYSASFVGWHHGIGCQPPAFSKKEYEKLLPLEHRVSHTHTCSPFGSSTRLVKSKPSSEQLEIPNKRP